jgi:hypothetical protein
VRRAAAVIGLLVALQVGGAKAADPPSPELFCEGAPGGSKPSVPPSAAPSPHWRDLELALALSVGLAGAVVYVVHNERRRRREDAPSIVWTPYVAGAVLGVVFALSLVAFGRPLGVSAGVQQGARLLASMVGKGGTAVPSPAGLWPLWVLAGVAMGGALSAYLRARSGSASSIVAAGESRARTRLVAFGAEVAATIAGGCTSGLALSGGIVLAPAAFVFMSGIFIGGIPTAWVATHLRRRHQGRTP